VDRYDDLVAAVARIDRRAADALQLVYGARLDFAAAAARLGITRAAFAQLIATGLRHLGQPHITAG
jgi:predicted DNA-binding protein (UPF0251 family)